MKKYNIKELEEKLNKCKKMSIKGINPNDIDNLEDIKIDRRKEPNERILDFITKTKNPYAFKIKGKIVKIEFSENGVKAEDALTNAIANIYR